MLEANPLSNSRRMLEASNAEVFVYTGGRGAAIPDDAVRIRVNSSVTSIPTEAFSEQRRSSLAEVELCEGLVEIGDDSFRELRPFHYENQHPHITQKDWRLCLLELSTNCYYSSQRWY